MFLLNDREYVVLARFLADYPSVAGGILQFGREHGHRGFFSGMEITQLLDGLGSYEGCVTVEDDDQVIRRKGLTGDHQRVACATLFALEHESYASPGNRLPDPVRFMPDDGIDIAGR